MKKVIILVAAILWVAIAACIYTITHRPVDVPEITVLSMTNNASFYNSSTSTVWFLPNSTNRTYAMPTTNP